MPFFGVCHRDMVSEESCGCDLKSSWFSDACLLASCLYFGLPVSCKTLEVQGNQALSPLVSLKDKPDNYPWLVIIKYTNMSLVDINVTPLRRMTAPKDIISYTQNHCFFYFYFPRMERFYALAFLFSFDSDAHLLGKRASSKKNNEM